LNRKIYMTVTATLFLVVAIMHLLRIIFGWQVEIGGLSIPFWVSWLGVLVAGALAYLGFTDHAMNGLTLQSRDCAGALIPKDAD
jgi:uncharacterized protein involved in cysteine biosynthesis